MPYVCPASGESTEMYLKAMAEMNDKVVAIGRLAERLSVTAVSANEMARRLSNTGFGLSCPIQGVS
jgi:Mn-dependent DtxR family transcriptional regulator